MDPQRRKNIMTNKSKGKAWGIRDLGDLRDLLPEDEMEQQSLPVWVLVSLFL